jgi:predicted transcriptional regulator
MKVKNIRIGIRKSLQGLEEAKEIMRKISKGGKVKSRPFELYFENLMILRKTITEERLKILKVIKKDKPDSVYKLAKLLERDLKNVNNDVHFLADLGLIELSAEKKGRNRIIPRVEYEKIILEIPIGI